MQYVEEAKRRIPGNFENAVLYSFDSLHYYNKNPDLVQTAYGGDRIIDTSGSLPKRFFERHLLDSGQLVVLRRFFAEAPCADEVVTTTCSPVFRDAILFYDRSGKYVCQVQLCFDCQMASFYGKWEVDLCDFNNKTDWNALVSFVKEIKRNSSEADKTLPHQ